jgi:hypothetical protein
VKIELNPANWFQRKAVTAKVVTVAAAAPSSSLRWPDGVSSFIYSTPTSVIQVSTTAKAEESDMSFISVIEGAEHSTVAWIEKELTVVEGKAPTIERVIDAGLTYVGPVLQIGLTAIGDAPEAALVGTVIAKAQVDLKAASALVTDFGPTPTASSMFSAVSNDLGSLLSAAQVKNTTTIATVTKAVSEVGILASAVKTAATAVVAAAK